MNKGIKHWPKSERPRETLLEKGPGAVSDAGLIAILLRVGRPGKDAVSLARELLKRFDGLTGLFNARLEDLKSVKGIKEAKIAQLLAATEIAKRQLRERLKKPKRFISPKGAFAYIKSSFRQSDKEIFKVLFLNAVNQLIGDEDLFHGTLNETAVYPREIAKRALENNAYSVILAHNHPSGKLQATERDIEITRIVIKALRALDVRVLDHVIVAGNRCLSMRLRKLVDF